MLTRVPFLCKSIYAESSCFFRKERFAKKGFTLATETSPAESPAFWRRKKGVESTWSGGTQRLQRCIHWKRQTSGHTLPHRPHNSHSSTSWAEAWETHKVNMNISRIQRKDCSRSGILSSEEFMQEYIKVHSKMCTPAWIQRYLSVNLERSSKPGSPRQVTPECQQPA